MEVNKMEKNNTQSTGIDNEEIMNRVNEKFEKIAQEAKDMVNNNDQNDADEYS